MAGLVAVAVALVVALAWPTLYPTTAQSDASTPPEAAATPLTALPAKGPDAPVIAAPTEARIVDDNAGPLLRQQQRDSTADTATGAGYDAGLSLQVHGVSFQSNCWRRLNRISTQAWACNCAWLL